MNKTFNEYIAASLLQQGIHHWHIIQFMEIDIFHDKNVFSANVMFYKQNTKLTFQISKFLTHDIIT